MKEDWPSALHSLQVDEMMTLTFESEFVPLRQDDSGVVRVIGSRVTLDTVLWAHNHGATPETIVQGYPTLRLADVYGIIAYYLRHRAVVDEYLEEGEHIAEALHSRIEADPRHHELRQRLLARLAKAPTPPA